MSDVDPGEILWQQFHGAFGAALLCADPRRIARAWSRKEDRTTWYARELLPVVARVLGLDIGYEHLVVDYHFGALRDGIAVPLVFIESENDAFTAHEEVWKLASLSAPLRILLTVGEWDESEGAWPHGGGRSEYLSRWRAIVAAHEMEVPRPGRTIALVMEWRDGVVRVFKERLSGDYRIHAPMRPWEVTVGAPWSDAEQVGPSGVHAPSRGGLQLPMPAESQPLA